MKKGYQKFRLILVGSVILITGLVSSCSKSSSGGGPTGPTPPTNPGGYDSSNQIASANLLSLWTFNGSVNDTKQSALVGTNTGTSFTAGLNGKQALQGSASTYSYVTYPTAGSLASLTSFTASMWIKAGQPVGNPGSAPAAGLGEQCIFQIVDSNQWQSNLHIGLTTFTSTGSGTNPPNADTLQLKVIMSNFGTGVVWNTQYLTAFLDTAVGAWTNVIVTYNSATSVINVYENGVAVGVSAAYSPNPATAGPILYANDPGSVTNTNGAPLYGALTFKNASALVVGAWSVNTTPPLSDAGQQPWASNYTGAVQNLRIYNSALSASDANSLYILEKAGF
jgi:Concanavalin A-like lectin/glucanases superfamily